MAFHREGNSSGLPRGKAKICNPLLGGPPIVEAADFYLEVPSQWTPTATARGDHNLLSHVVYLKQQIHSRGGLPRSDRRFATD